jgi:hypothetical protein
MTVYAMYWRHYCASKEEHESVEDAKSFTQWGESDGYLSTLGIVDTDNKIFYIDSIGGTLEDLYDGEIQDKIKEVKKEFGMDISDYKVETYDTFGD